MTDTIPFEYGGYHFQPYLTLRGKDAALDEISQHLNSDHEMGMCAYPDCGWQKAAWSYDDFYAASTVKYCDLFLCLENGRLYIPGKNELFLYNGTSADIKRELKKCPSRDER